MLLQSHRFIKSCEGSHESVQTTVKELEENLKEGIVAAGGSSRRNLAQAKVVGIACDVCVPGDVQKLSNFAVSELGSIDIWVSVRASISHAFSFYRFKCLLNSIRLLPFT